MLCTPFVLFYFNCVLLPTGLTVKTKSVRRRRIENLFEEYTMEKGDKKNNDCYFFYYSTCMKVGLKPVNVITIVSDVLS